MSNISNQASAALGKSIHWHSSTSISGKSVRLLKFSGWCRTSAILKGRKSQQTISIQVKNSMEGRNFVFSFNETIKNEDMTEASFFISWMCVRTGKGCETSVKHTIALGMLVTLINLQEHFQYRNFWRFRTRLFWFGIHEELLCIISGKVLQTIIVTLFQRDRKMYWRELDGHRA